MEENEILDIEFGQSKSKVPNERRKISIVCLAFTSLLVVALFQSWSTIVYLIKSKQYQEMTGISIVVWYCIGIVFFWYKYRVGWYLLVMASTVFAFGALKFIITNINSYLLAFENVETSISSSALIAQPTALIIHGFLLFLVCRKSIRQIYSIKLKVMILLVFTIGTGMILLH
ncbi:MAG: hypothetical protein AAF502_25185 [Bacteroidota bacterium]